MVSSIKFKSGDVVLAGDLYKGSRRGGLGAVVLHPHPLYGGDRRNSVVVAAAGAMADAGIPALCFDFRGAGGSGGVHGGGPPEARDVGAAIEALEMEIPDVSAVALVGYSFGAYVASLAVPSSDIASVACISPPQSIFPCDGLAGYKGPIMIVSGDRDQFAPADTVKTLAGKTGAGLEFLQGADHFLFGREAEVGRIVAGFISKIQSDR